MQYRVVLIESDEGFAVSCPALRGCHSEGATREEALENIQIAIREWLDAEREENQTFTVSEEIVTVPDAQHSGVSSTQAVRAFEKIGFRVLRQGKHIIMSDGVSRLVIPRSNPMNPYTMGSIARDAGLTPDEIRALL